MGSSCSDMVVDPLRPRIQPRATVGCAPACIPPGFVCYERAGQRRRQKVGHPSVDERRTRGKEAGRKSPSSSHGGWIPAADRPDPISSSRGRIALESPASCPFDMGG